MNFVFQRALPFHDSSRRPPAYTDAMPLSDRHVRRKMEAPAGRRDEFARLQAFISGDECLVLHLHGIPGIGKTHLLNALGAVVSTSDFFVVRIDARLCEPSPAALCRAIARQIGVPESEDPETVAARLSRSPNELCLRSTAMSPSGSLTHGSGRSFFPHSVDGCVRSSQAAKLRARPGASIPRGEPISIPCSSKPFHPQRHTNT